MSYNKRTVGITPPKVHMPTNKKSPSSEKKSISISGDVKESVVIVGDNNTVNKTTIIQKIINIFKSDSESMEQRNRRILLGHVENAWIKGVLDASLHGAALLDLGIKQDPEAVTKYPWAIKKESTDETLPAGTSMLEIFNSIGMGRSLLILGAPGSGKTTMLLELARELIGHAREDVTYPIPMVFNLASWSEEKQILNEKKGFFNKKTSSKISELAPFGNWLVNELNSIYSIPQLTALELIKDNKLFLLLDGLDEVGQKSRAKCVEAINAFRKEHGLTSLAVCSRSQDYADLNTKLSFEGAIEVQPLTQGQITEFFNRFGDEMAGVKQVLKKDSALREMAETPLFLSIMIMAYRDKQDVDILTLKDENTQRKHLFDTYIERVFERPRSKNMSFKKQNTLHWLGWLAKNMAGSNQSVFLIEWVQPDWLPPQSISQYLKISRLVQIGFGTVIISIFLGLVSGYVGGWQIGLLLGVLSLFFQNLGGLGAKSTKILDVFEHIEPMELVKWSFSKFRDPSKRAEIIATTFGIFVGGLMVACGLFLTSLLILRIFGVDNNFKIALSVGVGYLIITICALILMHGLDTFGLEEHAYPNQGMRHTTSNTIVVGLPFGLIFSLSAGMLFGKIATVIFGIVGFLYAGWYTGGSIIFRHKLLRLLLWKNNCITLNIVPFLNHCVDLIFLRRVGGGYIFVHRLLMEHFAEMYVETPTSKGN